MKYVNLLMLSLIMLTLFSCSEDDPIIPDPIPEITIADFEGSWIAVSANFTNNSDASESVEFISVGGGLRYTMNTGGGTRTWVEFQNNPVDEWDALLSLEDDNMLISTPEESSRPIEMFSYELGIDSITLTNNNASFDFTLSGAEKVSATSVLVFVPH